MILIIITHNSVVAIHFHIVAWLELCRHRALAKLVIRVIDSFNVVRVGADGSGW